jgi:hypothetical protein
MVGGTFVRVTREPLFRRLLGAPFDALPEAVRSVHSASVVRLVGECEVIRGEGWMSRLCGAVAGLPPAAERVPITVAIDAIGDGEAWVRDFGGHGFRSALRASDGELHERIGPASLRYRLVPEPDGIRWEFVGMRVLGAPLPAFAAAIIDARERVLGGAYTFDVRAALPGAGLLVHYRGRLAHAP